ncbi:hypothetical protein ACFQX6_17765 [Streptosporangium lutulentum]
MDYDEWYGELDSSASSDWSQLTVARIGDEPVAMLLGTDAFAGDENCGYVRQLAVLRLQGPRPGPVHAARGVRRGRPARPG